MFRAALVGLGIVALCWMSGIALAESVTEKTGVNSALGIAPKTQDFVTEAAQSDMFEIESSKLAQQKSQDSAIKDFAQQMITDHTKSSQELKSHATSAELQVPAAMGSANQSELTKLQGLNGPDFDKRYASDQLSGHKSAVSLFQRYGKGGDNNDLKTWAVGLLPTLQHHLDMAQDLKE
jgi:putative membrane protein